MQFLTKAYEDTDSWKWSFSACSRQFFSHLGGSDTYHLMDIFIALFCPLPVSSCYTHMYITPLLWRQSRRKVGCPPTWQQWSMMIYGMYERISRMIGRMMNLVIGATYVYCVEIYSSGEQYNIIWNGGSISQMQNGTSISQTVVPFTWATAEVRNHFQNLKSNPHMKTALCLLLFAECAVLSLQQ